MGGKKIRSVLQFLLLLSIGVFLIWLSVKSVAPQKAQIYEAFREADYTWIYLCMGISFLSHFLRAFRWNYLLKPVGHKVNLMNATCHVLIGYFTNYGIPRMGEITRCTLAAKYDKVPFEVGFGTVITERIIDFILFILIFILTLMLQFSELIGLANQLIFDPLKNKLSSLGGNPARLFIVAAGAIAFIAAMFMLRKKITTLLKGKMGGMLRGMAEGIGSVRKMEKPLQFVFLSVAIWACYFYSLYVCFFALSGTSHLGQKECLTLLLFGTLGVIVSPGGLGAYPAIVGGILMFTFHVDKVSSFALPWLSWTSQFAMVVVLGIICLLFLPLYNRNKHVISEAAKG